MTQTTNSSWDLTALFKSDSDPAITKWRKQVSSATNAFAKQWRNNSKYLSDPKTLRLALDQYNTWLSKYGDNEREILYFQLKSEQNETDPKLKAKLNQAIDFAQGISNQMSFFNIAISKIPQAQQKKLLAAEATKPYHYLLKNLFAAGAHTLTEAEEKIITLKSGPAHSNWIRMTSALLATESAKVPTDSGKTAELNLNQLLQQLSSHKKIVRDTAAKEINRILAKYADVAENEINSLLQDKQTEDKLRNFARPDAARHLSDEINSKTVDTLVSVVSKHFSVSSDYYQLKAKILGQKKLAYHERNIELGHTSAKFPYPVASQKVIEAFGNLDPEFAELTKNFISEGRIDVFPVSGKTGGAFCAHGLITQPIYILLNHSDRLDDVLTMAHELGHGINYELSKKAQTAVYYGTSLATAEVASTFMEDFVLDHIATDLPASERLNVIMSKLNSDISTIFRQIACYRFEQALHAEFRKVGYLDKHAIGKLFSSHMASYMGNYVEQTPGCENWWVYWGHIRRFFYNYSYANGLLISKALQRAVRRDPKFILRVKDFLAAGSSDSPERIFAKLGLDITKPKFWEEGIAEIKDQLKLATHLAKARKK